MLYIMTAIKIIIDPFRMISTATVKIDERYPNRKDGKKSYDERYKTLSLSRTRGIADGVVHLQKSLN